MSPLRKQMQADMVLRGLAPRTQEAYLAAVAGLARHYGQSLKPCRHSCSGWRTSILAAALAARQAGKALVDTAKR